MTYPPADATRADVDAWYREHAPPPHEVPPCENGPSLMCNACGVVRVALSTPFCRGCMAIIGPL